MAINATATYRLIRTAEPLLKAAERPRAIFLTSSRASHPRAFWGPYAASKAAVEALTRSWAQETENLPLRVNAFDPGGTRTAMRAQAFPGESPETLPHPSETAAHIMRLVDPALTETGKIYQVKAGGFVSYRLPE